MTMQSPLPIIIIFINLKIHAFRLNQRHFILTKNAKRM